MIDLQRVGDKVVFIGPHDNVEEIPVGDVGVITVVDESDRYMTYKVQFSSKGHSVWVDNPDLEILATHTKDVDHCGWRDRAMKAETELKELKKALATLSEG
jgi:hypothetical protein